MTQAIITLVTDVIPELISGAKKLYEEFRESQSNEKERRRRKEFKKALKKNNDKKLRDQLSRTIGDLRRTVDEL